MPKPKDFIEVLWDLTAPDMFNLNADEELQDAVYEQIIKDTRKTGEFPDSFLAWRDAAYDALEELGYEQVS